MRFMPSSDAATAAERADLVSIYLELAKARLSLMVIVTVIVGYLVASLPDADLTTLVWVVAGTALSASGANILNQWRERDRDRLMHRTRNRPLPAGRVAPARAAVWGVVSAVAGVAVLATGTNLVTAALGAFNILLYVLVYTPLKTRSPFNTTVGAVCGAIPPMMGWTAATGGLQTGAWILGGFLFVWQVPHFLALAWLYREDYARGGFRMLPAADPSGLITGRVAVVYVLALVPLCFGAYLFGLAGVAFAIGSVLLTGAFGAAALGLMVRRSSAAARRLFLVSILYLPLALGLMVSDTTTGHAWSPDGGQKDASRMVRLGR